LLYLSYVCEVCFNIPVRWSSHHRSLLGGNIALGILLTWICVFWTNKCSPCSNLHLIQMYNVWCRILTHQKLFIAGNPRLITLIYPPRITRVSSDINFVVLLNMSSRIWSIPIRLEDGSCMDLIPYLCNKQKKNIVVYYIFLLCCRPTDLS